MLLPAVVLFAVFVVVDIDVGSFALLAVFCNQKKNMVQSSRVPIQATTDRSRAAIADERNIGWTLPRPPRDP